MKATFSGDEMKENGRRMRLLCQEVPAEYEWFPSLTLVMHLLIMHSSLHRSNAGIPRQT